MDLTRQDLIPLAEALITDSTRTRRDLMHKTEAADLIWLLSTMLSKATTASINRHMERVEVLQQLMQIHFRAGQTSVIQMPAAQRKQAV